MNIIKKCIIPMVVLFLGLTSTVKPLGWGVMGVVAASGMVVGSSIGLVSSILIDKKIERKSKKILKNSVLPSLSTQDLVESALKCGLMTVCGLCWVTAMVYGGAAGINALL